MGKTSTLTIPTPAEFTAWMAEQSFTDRTLAAALGCHHTTVWKWRTARTVFDSIAWIACQHVAGGKLDRERRQRALDAIAAADDQGREGVRSARRAAEATASAR